MIKKIQDAKIKKQTVVLRLDLNIPYSNGKSSDTSRIEKTKETIHYLIKNKKGKIIYRVEGEKEWDSPEFISFINSVMYK